jgi:hypothetical protein
MRKASVFWSLQSLLTMHMQLVITPTGNRSRICRIKRAKSTASNRLALNKPPVPASLYDPSEQQSNPFLPFSGFDLDDGFYSIKHLHGSEETQNSIRIYASCISSQTFH